MYILADSSSMRTDWMIVDGSNVVEQAVTAGLNPFFNTRREISHIIRLYLPESFFRHRWEHVYFYGAGCASPERNKIVEQSVVAQFKTPTTVHTDLLGAARGMLIDRPGMVAILSTGANSCMYDGQKIVEHVRSGGYVLGDEGSNAYLGKTLLSDIIKKIAPAEIIEKFYARFNTRAELVIDSVYSKQPNIILAEYSIFLSENIEHPYCYQMVYDGFMSFLRRNIAAYDYQNNPLCVVGLTCHTYRHIFDKAANDFGVHIDKIATSPLHGLIEYHSRHRL